MSYSAPDQSDCLIELLQGKGYRITIGNGWNTRELQDGEGDDGESADAPELEEGEKHEYDPQIEGAWFTWSRPSGKGDVEVGETFSCALAAWTSAAEHFFDNAEIPEDVVIGPWTLDRHEARAVIIAVTHLLNSRIECAGDDPTDGGSLDELEAAMVLDDPDAGMGDFLAGLETKLEAIEAEGATGG